MNYRKLFIVTVVLNLALAIAAYWFWRSSRGEKPLENAAAVVAASGGSTNAALHLPAIAHECGIAFDLFDVAEVFRRTPYVADLKPSGRYVVKFRGAGQGPKALVAEAIVAGLAEELGLPLPRPAIVTLDDGFGRGEPDPNTLIRSGWPRMSNMPVRAASPSVSK